MMHKIISTYQYDTDEQRRLASEEYMKEVITKGIMSYISSYIKFEIKEDRELRRKAMVGSIKLEIEGEEK